MPPPLSQRHPLVTPSPTQPGANLESATGGTSERNPSGHVHVQVQAQLSAQGRPQILLQVRADAIARLPSGRVCTLNKGNPSAKGTHLRRRSGRRRRGRRSDRRGHRDESGRESGCGCRTSCGARGSAIVSGTCAPAANRFGRPRSGCTQRFEAQMAPAQQWKPCKKGLLQSRASAAPATVEHELVSGTGATTAVLTVKSSSRASLHRLNIDTEQRRRRQHLRRSLVALHLPKATRVPSVHRFPRCYCRHAKEGRRYLERLELDLERLEREREERLRLLRLRLRDERLRLRERLRRPPGLGERSSALATSSAFASFSSFCILGESSTSCIAPRAPQLLSRWVRTWANSADARCSSRCIEQTTSELSVRVAEQRHRHEQS